MPQKIKYQTTTISAEQSAGQIGQLIGKYGAREFTQLWDDDGQLSGIRFIMKDQLYGGIVPVKLYARTETIFDILTESGLHRRDAEARSEQAYRIAWRQLKDVVEQLLLAVRTGLFSLAEAFMAGVVIETPEGERTLGEYIAEAQPELSRSGRALKLLGSGR